MVLPLWYTVSMLLAVDLGNTNTAISLHDTDWQRLYRFSTNHFNTPDELSNTLIQLYPPKIIAHITKMVVSSVVPQKNHLVKTALETFVSHSSASSSDASDIGASDITHTASTPKAPYLLWLEPDIHTNLKHPIPSQLGSDLLANACYAHSIASSRNMASIVVDFGTALTITSVYREGKIAGVSICPGPETALKSLVTHTSQLPHITLAYPSSVLGHDSASAINSGLIMGYTYLVEGLITQTIKELKQDSLVFATGGLSQLIAPHTNTIDQIDTMHTLNGLKLLAELN